MTDDFLTLIYCIVWGVALGKVKYCGSMIADTTWVYILPRFAVLVQAHVYWCLHFITTLGICCLLLSMSNHSYQLVDGYIYCWAPNCLC